jgi:hypothetical protein
MNLQQQQQQQPTLFVTSCFCMRVMPQQQTCNAGLVRMTHHSKATALGVVAMFLNLTLVAVLKQAAGATICR